MIFLSLLEGFSHRNLAETQKVILQKSLQNIGHGDKIKGRRFRNSNFFRQFNEKSLAFLDMDFGSVFGSFSEALEAPKSMKFGLFSTLCRTQFQVHAPEPPKEAPQSRFWDLNAFLSFADSS